MNIVSTELPGVFIIEPRVFGDHRGWFMETYSEKAFAECGLHYTFVQDNQSFTAQRGTLRGLHFQNGVAVQAKLVRVTHGAVLDVAVDIRKGSPTYLKWVSVELSADNKRQLLIPRGFAHGFLTLSDDTEFCYKVDNLYNAGLDRGIRFDDPAVGVDWGLEDPVLSDKDKSAPLLQDSDCSFVWEGD